MLLQQVSCLDVVIKGAGLVLAHPDADQLTRDVVPLRQGVAPAVVVTDKLRSYGAAFAELGVDQAAWDRLIERSPVRIIYVPGAPDINTLAGQEPKWAFVLIAPSLGLIFGALGGFVLMRARRQGNGALASDTVAEGARRDRGSRQRVRKHRFRL
jgi:hypothetical protein